MTKEEILEQLKESGDIKLARKTPLWAKAFGMYIQEMKQPVTFSCRNCYKTVKKWLEKSVKKDDK